MLRDTTGQDRVIERSSLWKRHRTLLIVILAAAALLSVLLAYLLRYSHDPVPGFKKTDNTTTASVVLRWKASTPAPKP